MKTNLTLYEIDHIVKQVVFLRTANSVLIESQHNGLKGNISEICDVLERMLPENITYGVLDVTSHEVEISEQDMQVLAKADRMFRVAQSERVGDFSENVASALRQVVHIHGRILRDMTSAVSEQPVERESHLYAKSPSTEQKIPLSARTNTVQDEYGRTPAFVSSSVSTDSEYSSPIPTVKKAVTTPTPKSQEDNTPKKVISTVYGKFEEIKIIGSGNFGVVSLYKFIPIKFSEKFLADSKNKEIIDMASFLQEMSDAKGQVVLKNTGKKLGDDVEEDNEALISQVATSKQGKRSCKTGSDERAIVSGGFEIADEHGSVFMVSEYAKYSEQDDNTLSGDMEGFLTKVLKQDARVKEFSEFFANHTDVAATQLLSILIVAQLALNSKNIIHGDTHPRNTLMEEPLRSEDLGNAIVALRGMFNDLGLSEFFTSGAPEEWLYKSDKPMPLITTMPSEFYKGEFSILNDKYALRVSMIVAMGLLLRHNGLDFTGPYIASNPDERRQFIFTDMLSYFTSATDPCIAADTILKLYFNNLLNYCKLVESKKGQSVVDIQKLRSVLEFFQPFITEMPKDVSEYGVKAEMDKFMKCLHTQIDKTYSDGLSQVDLNDQASIQKFMLELEQMRSFPIPAREKKVLDIQRKTFSEILKGTDPQVAFKEMRSELAFELATSNEDLTANPIVKFNNILKQYQAQFPTECQSYGITVMFFDKVLMMPTVVNNPTEVFRYRLSMLITEINEGGEMKVSVDEVMKAYHLGITTLALNKLKLPSNCSEKLESQIRRLKTFMSVGFSKHPTELNNRVDAVCLYARKHGFDVKFTDDYQLELSRSSVRKSLKPAMSQRLLGKHGPSSLKECVHEINHMFGEGAEGKVDSKEHIVRYDLRELEKIHHADTKDSPSAARGKRH